MVKIKVPWYTCGRVVEAFSDFYELEEFPNKSIGELKRINNMFKKPEGHNCNISTGIHEGLTFGTGRLSEGGYWEKPCAVCARAWEQQFPEDDLCWPFPEELTLKSTPFENLKPNTYYLVKRTNNMWHICFTNFNKLLLHDFSLVPVDHINVEIIYELPKP